MKCSFGISNFLEEISSLSHSVVFLYFFALITEEGFLISPCYSLELCIQMEISFLFSFAFLFIYLFLKFYFIFKLYNIVLVLPNIEMNLPQVYPCPPPEPSSLLPPRTLPLGRPSAPAPSIQYHASNLDWWLVSYMVLYMFQCHSPKSSHPLPLPQSP